jgi:uncharacterized protein YwqG
VPKAVHITAFEEVSQPITDLVTKFGGQPVWLEKPCWPLNLETQLPLPFLCQIELDPKLFGDIPAKMAYIFAGVRNENTDSIDFDAQAIVLQPGSFDFSNAEQQTGPSIKEMCKHESGSECGLLFGDYIDEPIWDSKKMDNAEFDDVENFRDLVRGIKIGGTPALFVDWMKPDDGLENWNLLLQIDTSHKFGYPYPCGLDDTGMIWFYVSKDGLSTTFLAAEEDY